MLNLSRLSTLIASVTTTDETGNIAIAGSEKKLMMNQKRENFFVRIMSTNKILRILIGTTSPVV